MRSAHARANRDCVVVRHRASYPPTLLYDVARPYEGGYLVEVVAAEVVALPRPGAEVEVDEGSSVGEVKHHGHVIELFVFEAAMGSSCVGPEAQLARLVVVCSRLEGSFATDGRLSEGGRSFERASGPGLVILDRTGDSSCPEQEPERVDDLHRSRLCLFRPG